MVVIQMNLLDILDLYAMEHDSSDLFLMLQDYTLDSRIDRDVMNKIILKELGARRCITNTPEVFKFMLEEFFNKYSYNIVKLIDTMYYEYDPLTNKNITRTEDREDIRDDDTGDVRTNNLLTETDNTTKLNTSAYDVDTYQPRTENVIDASVRDTGTITDVGTLHRFDTGDLDIREWGKDGQDSYQKLIKDERELARFNIFNWIIQQMRRELFLLIY